MQKYHKIFFLLVFLLTRLHDNELKLFIHDFEYSTIDNTEADNPTDHLKPEKVQPHIVVQGPEREG